MTFTPKLKSGALPTRVAQEVKTCDQATQTTDSSIQKGTLCESTQTAKDVSKNTPRKRKLSKSLHDKRLKKKEPSV